MTGGPADDDPGARDSSGDDPALNEPTGEEPPTGGPTGEEPSSADPRESDVDVETVVAYLKWGGLVALAILAVVAGVGIYTSISAMIEIWIADHYQPVARAAFNLAALFVAVAGMLALLRRT